MLENLYEIKDTDELITPALIYYKDIIVENTKKAIEIAGSPDRLWPHVKSHKMIEMIKLQQSMGINKFKCATIAEGEVLVECQAKEIVLAYPLVGPNIKRFIALKKSAPKSRLWAIGDNYEQIKLLAEESLLAGVESHLLIDVNSGMDRTGVSLEDAENLYRKCYDLEGIILDGFHSYDGHHKIKDIDIRGAKVSKIAQAMRKIQESIEKDGLSCSVIIVGGTPSFPCHAEYEGVFLSPGTLFISDYGSYSNLPDMDFIPAGTLMTRVVSNPKENLFTIDLGSKGIATDPLGIRGIIVGFEKEASPLFQSEEHWVFKMNDGYEDCRPEIGTVMYIIPTHVCPTSALYPEVLVAESGEIIDAWQVTARNRKITI